ncbi:MAG: DedA family protein [Betaproteobacteria bacterium]
MLQDTAALLHHYGYLVIFVVLAIEGTGMPGVPLEIVFLGAGYLIRHGQMSFELAIVAAALGNTFGNLVGYMMGATARVVAGRRRDALRRPAGRQGCGRRGGTVEPGERAVKRGDERRGRAVRERYTRRLSKSAPLAASRPSGEHETRRLPRRLAQEGILSRVDLSRVEGWFRRYGAATVFIGRWFGPIRTPAILASGFIGIDIRKYLAASALASFSWCFTWQLCAWKLSEAVVRLLKPHLFLQMLRLSSWELLAAALLLAVVALLALRLVPGGSASK